MRVVFDDDCDTGYTSMKIPFSLKDSNGDPANVNVSTGIDIYIHVDGTSTMLSSSQYSLSTSYVGPSGGSLFDYVLEILPTAEFDNYLRVLVTPSDGTSFVPRRFTIYKAEWTKEEVMTIDSNATSVEIPFTLIYNAGTSAGQYASGQSSFSVYILADGAWLNTSSGRDYSISEVYDGDGDYTMTIDLGSGSVCSSFTEYLRVYVSCSGCYDRIFNIRRAVASTGSSSSFSLSSTDISNIATGVWSAIATDSTKIEPITHSVWGHASSSDTSRTLTSATLSNNSALATVADLSNNTSSGNTSGNSGTTTATVDTGAIASAVWGYTGTRALNSATLSTGSALATVADLSNSTSGGNNSGNSGTTTVTVNTSDIAAAVWGYTGTRALNSTTVGSDTLATTDDLSSISASSSLSLSAADLEDIAAAVWGDTEFPIVRTLSTAELDNGSLAKVGSAMTLTAAYNAAKTAPPTTTAIANAVWGRSSGTTRELTDLSTTTIADAVWGRPSGTSTRALTSADLDVGSLATEYSLSDLATAEALSDAVDAILDEGAASWTTATGFEDPLSTISVKVSAIQTKVNTLENANLTGLATSQELATVQSAIIAAIPTVGAIWGRELDDTTSRTITNAPNISNLVTKSELTAARDAILTQGNEAWVTATGFATPSDIPEMITASDIATEVWTSSSRVGFAREILTTDVGTLDVTDNAYTLKHLIMASQYSYVTPVGTETHWVIRDKRTENGYPKVIATRILTLNDNGAINATE